MRAGLMLAAGESSRLPNKALLPLRNQKPVITSGIDMLLRSGCHVIVVVLSPESLLSRILRALYPQHNFIFRYQDVPTGVGGALAAAKEACAPFDDVVVTFCDNVFDEREAARGTAPCASVRRISGRELDGHLQGMWLHRDQNPLQKLAGWYILNPDHLDTTIMDSIDFLNSIQASAVNMDYPWYDIGTLDAYQEYWR